MTRTYGNIIPPTPSAQAQMLAYYSQNAASLDFSELEEMFKSLSSPGRQFLLFYLKNQENLDLVKSHLRVLAAPCCGYLETDGPTKEASTGIQCHGSSLF